MDKDGDDGRALVERYLAAYTSFDVERMCDLLAPAIRFENYADDQLTASATGIDEFRRLAEGSAGLFSAREQKLVSLRVEGSTAIAVVMFKGTLARDIEGGPVAGSTIGLTGKSEFEFNDGRIMRIIDRS